MSNLEQQMRNRDREMVPKRLVQAMFALMLASVALVTYAQVTGRPMVGVLVEAPIVAERAITFEGDRSGVYVVRDALTGETLVSSADHKQGFIGVMGRVIERDRMLHAVEEDLPVRVVRRDNGNIAVIDDETGLSTELIGYGADNVAAFAALVN